MNILCTYNYGREVFSNWEQMGYTVTYVAEDKIDDSVAFETIEILICYNPFKNMPLHRTENLRYIILSSIGFDQVPSDLMNREEITVINNHGGYSVPIGEWIVMMLLIGFKRGLRLMAYAQKHLWKLETDLLEMTGKKIVFLGTGTLAIEAVKRLRGFDAVLIGINTDGRWVDGFECCYPIDQLKTHVKDAAAVVCCLPLTPKTRGLIDKSVFTRMPKGSIFINVSRGSVVNEEDLMAVQTDEHFAFVSLDVFDKEPLAPDHSLWSMPNALQTSHQSWVSERRSLRRLSTIQAALQGIISNRPIPFKIDKRRGY